MSTTFRTEQTLYIVRHGTAYHNVSNAHDDLTDPKWIDPALNPHGHGQAEITGMALQRDHHPIHFDWVITSPLTRTLETTMGIVKQLEPRVRWIAQDELREAYGIHYSNRRSNLSILEAQWPHVDFQKMTEGDKQWRHDCHESWTHLGERIDWFLCLTSWNQLHPTIEKTNESGPRPGSNVLIVSHSKWMDCLFRKYCPQVLEGRKRIYNCDTYRAQLVCDWRKEMKDSEWKCKKIALEDVALVVAHSRK